QVETSAGKVLTTGEASQQLTVLEHDGPALTIALPTAAIPQGTSTVATISRNTPTTDPLTVTLASSDTSQVTVPSSVIIPAGQASASFPINGVNDGLADAEQFAQISAAAPGLEGALATLGVTSVDLPDLIVTNITAPTTAFAGSTIQVS